MTCPECGVECHYDSFNDMYFCPDDYCGWNEFFYEDDFSYEDEDPYDE